MSSLEAVRADGYYYGPEYDPKKHGSLNQYRHSHPLGERAKFLKEGILIVRFEMPFKVVCEGCGHIIAKGVRFNAEKKCVGFYFTTKILEFSFSCPDCKQAIVITTDPKNCKYVCTKGVREKVESFDVKDAETLELLDEEEREKIRLDPMKKLEYQKRHLLEGRFCTTLNASRSGAWAGAAGGRGDEEREEKEAKKRGGEEEEEGEAFEEGSRAELMTKVIDDLIDLQNSRHADDYSSHLALRERLLLKKQREEEKIEEEERGRRRGERKEGGRGLECLLHSIVSQEEKKGKKTLKKTGAQSSTAEAVQTEVIGGGGEAVDQRGKEMSREDLEDLIQSRQVRFRKRRTAVERLLANSLKKSSSIFDGADAQKAKKRALQTLLTGRRLSPSQAKFFSDREKTEGGGGRTRGAEEEAEERKKKLRRKI